MLNAFNNGVVIENPHPVAQVEIIQAPLPDKVVLPLQQRIGEQAEPCVEVGDLVLTGQLIAQTTDQFCTPIHASISGVVVAIDEQIIPHKSGLKSKCITIESDGKDEWIKDEWIGDFLHCSREILIDCVQQSGIVGLGGAGFPTHSKLDKAIDCQTLIINATECEPGIMCDDALMQYFAREVILGVEVLLRICGAQKVIIAIEDDKQEAYQSLLMFNHNERITIRQIPTKYTSGAEKLLIKTLLDIEIPADKLAIDKGIVCQNVSTAKAIFDAVVEDRPLVSRVVTVTGDAVIPNNFEVRLGASFEHIVALAKPNNQPHEVRMGGMMMGVDVASLAVPICKITNCIFVNNVKPKPSVQECIRCGQCNQVCPVDLLPQQLYWYAKSENTEKAMRYNLSSCIECRCCDVVCPSHIPLAEYFSFAKALHRKETQEKQKIDKARKRFEYREYRLERNKIERAEMMERKKAELKKKMAGDKIQKDKIVQAMARVKKKNDSDT
ncbi:electron transport complex subunit RsxC [Bathymodiolus septemdierum thioautotrophic gill symbiont]|uniref:Ion-translocating oxidoreductase complex subunit C n=1 Tax=endosymbiont of Bathymodiolus septemdierum str. Myojin knoll TaxID=1303921 RepID=A0A0P0UT60_9GAMM|nr:electron transport complex subunit RsxC [Bathymodiolus septemdierum thioautotrophic gill symbiont]BAS68291.1 electron transport complex protein RnfC [endosymbiont of Bathymodiolus septemdierum str. Myojin knoll]